jgi:methionyl-tRNA formyltransferase
MISPGVEILCSDPTHPIYPRLLRWQADVAGKARVRVSTRARDVEGGDVLFLIACQEIVGRSLRDRFRHALVIHESDLPKGRGWSPLVWQVLEGRTRIPVTLLDAADKVDSGKIWQQRFVELDGTELADEINRRVSDAKIALMDWALDNIETAEPREQSGEPSYYPRRTPADSEIDPASTFADAFDLLRIADENRYPAFIRFRGKRFRIRIDEIGE